MKCGDVAIVRMAAQSALGQDLDECVATLRSARGGVRQADALEQVPQRPAGIGQVPLAPAVDPGTSRAELLLSTTLHQLLSHGDLARLSAAAPQTSIVIGTTLAGMRHCGEGLRCEAREDVAGADTEFAKMPAGAVLRSALAGLPVEGIAVSVSCACASALSAVMHGCALVQSGLATCVIAGGYDPISEFSYAGFSALQLVAQGPLSPFAPDREGMKLGEGCALLLLCPLSLAKQHGFSPIAVIEAGGESSDAHHLTHPHPEGRGAARALRGALNGSLPNLLVAHATGTPGNDDAEHAALRSTFGDQLPRIPVSALKSRVGHPLGAAGALELVMALGCAEAGFIPAGIGRQPDKASYPTLDLVHNDARAEAPQRLTALAAGFGGANVAVTVVRNAAAKPRETPAVTRIGIRAMGAVCAGGRGAQGLNANDPGRTHADLETALAPLLDRGKTRRLALLPRLLLAAVRDMLDSSGLTAADLTDVPLLAASWLGAAEFTEQYYRDLLKSGIDLANPMLFAESVPNIGSAHVSMAYGMTAASATVVGTRTAGLEALALTIARMRAGHWQRALVVAGDETHPIVSRVLGHCVDERSDRSAGAVALLLELDAAGAHLQLCAAHPCGLNSNGVHHTRVTTQSGCDRPLRDQGFRALEMPGLGAASGLAALVDVCTRAAPRTGNGGGSHRGMSTYEIGCAEPAGSSWSAVVAT